MNITIFLSCLGKCAYAHRYLFNRHNTVKGCM